MTTRRLGWIALGCCAARAAVLLGHSPPGNLLWSCNVASLLAALGLLLGSATGNAAGGLLLLAGDPVWIVDLLGGGRFEATSLLTHVGVTALSVVGMRRLGAPRWAWPAAVGTLAAATIGAALTSSAVENVNLAVVTPPGWERFPSHGLYMLWLGGTLCLAMLGLLAAIRRVLARGSRHDR